MCVCAFMCVFTTRGQRRMPSIQSYDILLITMRQRLSLNWEAGCSWASLLVSHPVSLGLPSPHMSRCLNYRPTVRSGFYVGTEDGKLRSLQACAEITLPNEPSLGFGYDYLVILCIVSLVCAFNLLSHYPLF